MGAALEQAEGLHSGLRHALGHPLDQAVYLFVSVAFRTHSGPPDAR